MNYGKLVVPVYYSHGFTITSFLAQVYKPPKAQELRYLGNLSLLCKKAIPQGGKKNYKAYILLILFLNFFSGIFMQPAPMRHL